jgi:dipeptidyl aminopeptidase/acylaminoacyl peptidase
VALMDLETGRIDLPEAMGVGKNSSPQWSPDGQSLAFVSDRNGVNNLYLFELGDRQAYQLTDFYTGIQGITPLSPTLSWSQGSDRIAFVYFEQGKYDVYTLSSPPPEEGPWRPGGRAGHCGSPAGRPARWCDQAERAGRPERRCSNRGRRSSCPGSALPVPGGVPPGRSLAGTADWRWPAPSRSTSPGFSTHRVRLRHAEFLHRGYKVKFNPEYVSQPTIGYARDNFGRGLCARPLVSGDMLGDQRMRFSAT